MTDYKHIPAEAIFDAADAVHARYPDEVFGKLGQEAQMLAIEAAAPRIAQRARIDELKRVIERCDRVYDTHGQLLHLDLMRELRVRIAELEADDA